MTTPNPRRSVEQAERAYFLSRTAIAQQFGPISAITAANGSIIEIPYYGRTGGAVQIYSTDGGAFTATFKVQGTLLPGVATSDPTTFAPMFMQNSTDNDYVDITGLNAITTAGIYQIPANAAFSRIRVICSAYTSGNPGIRIL
jgi:hypothetical protein